MLQQPFLTGLFCVSVISLVPAAASANEPDDASAAAAALQQFFAAANGSYCSTPTYAYRINPSHLNWSADQTGVDQLAGWREMMVQQSLRAGQSPIAGYGPSDWRESVYRAAIASQFHNNGGCNSTSGTGWTGGVFAYPNGFYDPSVNSNYYYIQGQNGATCERYGR